MSSQLATASLLGILTISLSTLVPLRPISGVQNESRESFCNGPVSFWDWVRLRLYGTPLGFWLAPRATESFPSQSGRWNAQIGGYGPPIATHAWLGRRFVELKGIHINKNHCRTQILEAARGHNLADLVCKESGIAIPGERREEKYMCSELPGNRLGFFQFANSSLPPSREHRSPISSRSPHINLHAQAQLPAIATSDSIHVPCELSVPCTSTSSTACFPWTPRRRPHWSSHVN